MGDAEDWPVTSRYPIPGGWIKFKGGHVAPYNGQIGDVVVFSDANFDGRGTIRIGQTMKLDDPRIEGYGFKGNLSLSSIGHQP